MAEPPDIPSPCTTVCVLDPVTGYCRGCLVDDGEMAALAAMPARGRTLPARHQPDMLRRIHGRLAPAMEFDAFVLDNIADSAARRRRIDELRADAAPFAWLHVHGETI